MLSTMHEHFDSACITYWSAYLSTYLCNTTSFGNLPQMRGIIVGLHHACTHAAPSYLWVYMHVDLLLLIVQLHTMQHTCSLGACKQEASVQDARCVILDQALCTDLK